MVNKWPIKKQMRIYWYVSKPPFNLNFGDWITPYIYKKITGKNPTNTNPKTTNGEPYVLGCGSILQFATPNAIVWGSGAIKPDISISKGIAVLSVRGPLTKQVLKNKGIDCPEIYGDPGLLLPRFYMPTNVEKIHEIGIIPHYVDYKECLEYFSKISNKIKIINVCRPLENVIDDIYSCKTTFSSSLHGIIVSHAYNVNCVWIKNKKNKIVGDNFKFLDYYASRGITKISAVVFTTITQNNIQTIIDDYPQPDKPFDDTELFKLCPF